MTYSTSSISSNEELRPGIAEIDRANDQFFQQLEALRDQPYFRYYSVDILASCEYMPQELFECYTESCEIYPEDEAQVSMYYVCILCSAFVSCALVRSFVCNLESGACSAQPASTTHYFLSLSLSK